MKNIDVTGILFIIGFSVVVAFLYAGAFFMSGVVAKNIAVDEINPTFLQAQAYQQSIENFFKKIKNEIHLGFVGDIMLGRGIEKTIAREADGDFRFPFLKIADALRKYDILFGNLEGPVSDLGADEGSLYSFRMNPRAIDGLLFAGFDALSVANNHIGDWGTLAMRDTFERIKNSKIIVVGGGSNEDEAYREKIIEKKGTKIAYLGFSQFGKGYLNARVDTPGIAVIDEKKLEKSIKKTRKNADVVVVSFHFGDEYQAEPNAYQIKIAHLAADAGADIVVGHHSHMTQPLEKYKNSYIAYSLGNFVFDQAFSIKTMEGHVLEVIIENKSVRNVVEHIVRLNNLFQPELIN